jgi:glyoxylase-like metal-dependent hydrolase (beta-lactamase superfamily II)
VLHFCSLARFELGCNQLVEGAANVGLGLFVRAADPHEGDRPKGVYAENWVRISDIAGIIVSHMSSDKIAGVLYVKRADKWIQVSIENPQGAVEGAN